MSSRGRQALMAKERTVSPSLEWVLTPPLQRFRLELCSPPPSPAEGALSPGGPQAQFWDNTSSSESWLLAPRIAIWAACSGLNWPRTPPP